MSEEVEVVISGMSGLFPECLNVPEFRDKLFANESLITTDDRIWPSDYKYKFDEYRIPHATGKYPRGEGNKFDANVFSTNTHVAKVTDNLNRMILEKSFEAIVDSGINPKSIYGTNGAVYSSVYFSEFDIIAYQRKQAGSQYSYLLGTNKAYLSNRVSFSFNLKGPSCTLFTTWEGGITGLQMAHKYIREEGGDCAIVAVSSRLFNPKISIQFLQLGRLSADGLCRAFDENADGYGRSEATVVLFLQRGDMAKRNYGTVVFANTLTNAAHANTVLCPDRNAIEKTLEYVYEKNGVAPEDVSFAELEAPGVKNLEKEEANAVCDVLCNGKRREPLLVGSVKSNVGHTEASSSLVSLVKAIITLEANRIPANINFSKLNEDIEALKSGKMKVVTENTTLPGPLVAVNCVGFSGVLGHAVLRQNPRCSANDEWDKLPRLVFFQGRTMEGLEKNLKALHAMPFDKNFISMTNDVYQIPMQTHKYRAFSILPFSEKSICAVQELPEIRRPIWFMFSGMGSQWTGMGEGLLEIPVFAEAIAKCDAVLKPKGLDIYEIITTKDESIFDNILHSFVGIASIQVGLVDILTTLGIVPDGLLGHSAGETACAYADGCFTLEQTVLSAYARGTASNEAKTIKGKMAAVGKGYEELSPRLPPDVEIACRNSSINCTISGPAATVEEFVKELKGEGTFARTVNTANIAYHSKYIAPAGPYLLEYLKQFIPNPKKRSRKWVSTSVPECNWGSELAFFCSAEYHTNNLLGPVLFEEGCKHIPKNAVVVEIAPHGLFQAILKESLNEGCVNVPLTLRNSDSIRFLLSAIGKIFLNGHQPNINAIYPKISYPVPRNTPSLTPFISWDHARAIEVIQLADEYDDALSAQYIKLRVHQGSPYVYLMAHKIFGECVTPPSLYLYLAWYVLSFTKNEAMGVSNVIFENIVVRKLLVSLREWRDFRVQLFGGTGMFEVIHEDGNNLSSSEVVATGTVRFDEKYVPSPPEIYDKRSVINKTYERDEFYSKLAEVGYELKAPFTNILSVKRISNDYFGKIVWNGNYIAFLNSLISIFMLPEIVEGDSFPYAAEIRKIALNCEKFRCMDDRSELEFYKCFSTKRLTCEGVEIIDVSSTPLISPIFTKNRAFQALKFVPHLNPNFENLSEFLNLCLEICVENASMDDEGDGKLHLPNTGDELYLALRNFVKENEHLKEKVVLYDLKTCPPDKCCKLTVGTISECYEKCADGAFFHLNYDNNNDDVQGFATVCRWKCQEGDVILRKKIGRNGIFPVVCEEGNSVPDKSYRKLVVKRNISYEDLSVIVSKKTSTRYVFILDSDAPSFSADVPFYKSLILQDLPVSVLKDGRWGSYRKWEINRKYSESVEIQRVSYNSKEAIVKFSRIENGENGRCFLEYSGVMDDRNIAGFAISDPLSKTVISDSILTWDIPRQWPLQDSYRVPLAYSLAYRIFTLIRFDMYAIFLNIFEINAFVEACVTLALHKNIRVFLAVSKGEDKIALMKAFPYLKGNQILLNGDCAYELEFIPRPKCMVVNCVPGLKHLEACMKCVAKHGCCVDMAGNASRKEAIGMFFFCDSRSMYAVENSVTSLLTLPDHIKLKIRRLVNDGIFSGVIRPISKFSTYRRHRIQKIFVRKAKQTWKIPEKMEKPTKIFRRNLQLDGEHAYAIVTSENRRHHAEELTAWLSGLGVGKIVLISEKCQEGRKFTRNGDKISEILTLKAGSESVARARNLLTEADKMAPLEAIFFITENSKKIRYFDEASRSFPPVHFISVFSGGLLECERRRRDGLPAIIIHGEKLPKKLNAALKQMKHFFAKYGGGGGYNEEGPLICDLSLGNGIEKRNDKIASYFPSDVNALAQIVNSIHPGIDFVEKTSMSPKYADVKGVYPVYIVPAAGESPLRWIIQHSLYPVFCATLTREFHPADIWAARLAAAVERIQPRGPVNVVGETWKSCVALELSQLLLQKGRRVKLTLLEGDPGYWKKSFEALGNPDTCDFDQRLLQEIFSFGPEVKIFRQEYDDDGWEAVLKGYLKIVPEHLKSNVEIAVNSLRNSLLTCIRHQPRKCSSDVLNIRHINRNFVTEYCNKEDVILFEWDRYSDFLKDPHVITAVNSETLYEWT